MILEKEVETVKISVLKWCHLFPYRSYILDIQHSESLLSVTMIDNIVEEKVIQIEQAINEHIASVTTITDRQQLEASKNYGRELLLDFGAENTGLVKSGQIAYSELFEVFNVLSELELLINGGYLKMASVWIEQFPTKFALFAMKPYFNEARRAEYKGKLDNFLIGL